MPVERVVLAIALTTPAVQVGDVSTNRVDRLNHRDDGIELRSVGYYSDARHGFWHCAFGWQNQEARCSADRDSYPPGQTGSASVSRGNAPGIAGDPGMSPNRFSRCRTAMLQFPTTAFNCERNLR